MSDRQTRPRPATPVSIAQAFLEAFFVVLGVLLAFGANEWRESRHQEAQATTALAAIVEELEANREAASAARDYHLGLLRQLVEIARAGGPPPAIEVFSRGFVSPASVLSTAWDTARATDVLGHLDYDLVLTLSRTYAQQEAYASQSRTVGELIYGELMRGGKDALLERYRQLTEIIGTFVWRERQLLDAYARALEAVGGTDSDIDGDIGGDIENPSPEGP